MEKENQSRRVETFLANNREYWSAKWKSGDFRRIARELLNEAETAFVAQEEGDKDAFSGFGKSTFYYTSVGCLQDVRKILLDHAHTKECKLFLLQAIRANLIGTRNGELLLPDYFAGAEFDSWRDIDCYAEDTYLKFDIADFKKRIDNGDCKVLDLLLHVQLTSDQTLDLFRYWVERQSPKELEGNCFRLVRLAIFKPELFERMAAIVEEREQGIFSRLRDSNGNGILWYALPACDTQYEEHTEWCWWQVYESEESRRMAYQSVAAVLMKLGCDPDACGAYGLNWRDISTIAQVTNTDYFFPFYHDVDEAAQEKERGVIALLVD